MNQFGLGEVEFNNRQPDEALKSFRSALDVVGTDVNGQQDHDQMVSRLYLRIGRSLNGLGAHKESIESFRRSIAIVEAQAAKSPNSRPARRNAFAVYQTVVGPLAGTEMLNAGNWKDAQAYARKALAMAEEQAAADSTNAQARGDLAFAYWTVGNSLRSTPAVAEVWYRKSLTLTKTLPRHEGQHLTAFREEALAGALVAKKQAAERLRLLLDANDLRQAVAKTEPTSPQDRLHMARSYCKLSEAELGIANVPKAREYADKCAPLLAEFHLSSPSLLVLRDLAYCYKVLGTVQSRVAGDRPLPAPERHAAAEASREWYIKTSEVWLEWNRRGAASAESETERHNVERRLQAQ